MPALPFCFHPARLKDRLRPEIMTLIEFKQRFAQVREQGFIRSARSGPTGIGHTLEQLLQLTENNLPVPDLGEVELKAHRQGGSNLITLFTFNRKAWVMNPLAAVRKYGTLDANGRKGLYFTMSPTPNSSNLFLHVTDDSGLEACQMEGIA